MERLTATGGDGLDEGYWKALLAAEEGYLHQPSQDEEAWRAVEESLAKGEVLELVAKGYNRGGLLVELNGLTGFVPFSHLEDLPYGLEEGEKQAQSLSLLGQPLKLKVIEVDRARGRLLLSQRAVKWEETPSRLWESIVPGQVRSGRVVRLCSFGAFVDLGGFDGLLHISELSWQRVNHPSELLKVGQEIEVYVLDVDRERKRVALSLKRLQPDPWSRVGERYQMGQIVEGMVTDVVDFGAFVRLEEGLEGLIHLSELAEGDFMHPHNVVREGEMVRVCILNIDLEKRRMGLSLRQVK